MADDSRYHIDGLFADFSGHVGDLESPESYVGTFQRETLLFAGPAPGRYGAVRCAEDSVLKKVAPIADRLAVVHNATISRFSRAFFFRDTNEPLLGNHPVCNWNEVTLSTNGHWPTAVNGMHCVVREYPPTIMCPCPAKCLSHSRGPPPP